MKATTRSISGALVMLSIIPLFAGLLACMPVPVGDPERSRIDPDISGFWVYEEPDAAGADLYLFQPYDKRTWLVSAVDIELGADATIEKLDIDNAEDLFDRLRTQPIGRNGLTADGATIYKVWLTRLGGERLMTWELVAGMNKEGSFVPDCWFVWKFEKQDRDTFLLYILDAEHEAFDDIVKPEDYEGDDYPRAMQRTWERAIRRNLRASELFSGPFTFRRVPEELADDAAELFQEVLEFE